MARKSFAMKRDLNEREIVNALADAGLIVYRLDAPCDLLTWCAQHAVWMCWEVKNPKRPKRLTPQQVIDHTRTIIWILKTADQAKQIAHEACVMHGRKEDAPF